MQKGANNSYFGNIWEGIASSWQGLKLSFKHIWEARQRRTPIGITDPDYFKQETGIVTLTYPYESLPVPDNGRYRLHNEMEDCIVCDKCAEICPVSCIDIEAVKSTEEIRKTSDGHSVRLYAARFDIDMAKCCFCGLCTTVCPTECLTMTKTYDFSEFDIRDMIYHFSDLSPEQAVEKRQNYETVQAAKQQAKASTTNVQPTEEKTAEQTSTIPATAKPVMKKPAIKPVTKPVITDPTPSISEETSSVTEVTPEISQTIQEVAPQDTKAEEADQSEQAPAKPVMKKPVIKPMIKKKTDE
ncbi:4Fe-4S dicluster domain-containing protein [Xanthocytophaga flava]|uniref:4Fe-4S dicluster domain-containing protein n=1 Tax=Xanthocytophaga flava TaxID=3048013 RepID=UPI0028D1B5B2|nr:4Fe-4S dicluster domain-containing protein [Xanthocytophaga flavus]MDJ1471617.1 4Fe-4S dicluster domain-containing protein [Xanthocytophaga flavus]